MRHATAALISAVCLFIVAGLSPAAAEDRWARPVKITVAAGSTTRVGGFGDAQIHTCQIYPAPVFRSDDDGQLGRFSATKKKKKITEKDTGSGQCDGREAEVTDVYYTAGTTRGTERVSFLLLFRGGYPMRYTYEITVK